MSNIISLLNRLFTALLKQEPGPVDPDTMSLQDWADLPAHHPSGDRAPC